MLLTLRIRDFAIIDSAEVELPPGFTVITGETGAGKSILVGALTLAMGGRAPKEVVRTGAECAQVEALFDIARHPLVQARLQARDLQGDDPHVLLIRRVIGPRGRAKVLVNGHLSTVATLAELVRGLVDISGQHEQQSLLGVENHLGILDSFANLGPACSAYTAAYSAWQRLCRDARRQQDSQTESLRRAEFVRFGLDEIAAVAPQPGEDQDLAAEQSRLAHAERLRQGASAAEALLYGEDGSAFDRIGKACSELAQLADIDPDLRDSCEALGGARREIEEVARHLQRYSSRIEGDPARLEEIGSRLTELQRLARKHGGSLVDLLRHKGALQAEYEALQGSAGRSTALAKQLQAAKDSVLQQAAALTAARTQAAKALRRAIEAEVADMDLQGAQFVVQVSLREAAAAAKGSDERLGAADRALAADGADAVEFLWSANRGEPPRPLARIASGGELSRLMLAVKGVLCDRDLVSVYVFDEVDSGLGGAAADSIGRKIARVAAGHQAITITHLAPIAARANFHLRVRKQLCPDLAAPSKSSPASRTVSKLEGVTGTARAEEIARMIDGADITEATRQAARAMLARGRPKAPKRRAS
jgi:DNA repair protein RecN (Recombination protein N)